MNIKEINKGIHMLSTSIDEMLFEGMWELPHGVSINSFIVKGEKTAIIDGIIGWDGLPETLYESLGKIDINPEKIDYVIVNHMEPDHAGWLENFKKINKDFTILTTLKGSQMIEPFYGNSVNVQVVKEGDTIDLGGGKTLTFHPAPNVHWPETMMTYETSSKTLFTCDMFGAFGSLKDHYFDDEMTEEEVKLSENEAERYFSNVLTTFSMMVEKAIKKTKEFDLKVIAPGHGPIYRSNPQKIIEDYEKYCQFAKGYGKNEVAIVWGSMYGMTQKAVVFATEILNKEGIKVHSIQMPNDSESEMVSSVFKSAGIILATPTYEYKMYPPVAHALDELGRKRINNKEVFRFGSYGWSGGAEKELAQIVENHKMKWNFIESVEFNGQAKEEDLSKIESGIKQLIKNMKSKLIK
ncbi:MAG: FprA family A-type flavoprotein [Tenericutes bacterium]|nr:FprA family A-type flavoprotein [Mycoplasmatota bacterium]